MNKPASFASQPRAQGQLCIDVGGDGQIEMLYQQGASKVLFPKRLVGNEAIFINTSGGLTSGDHFTTEIKAKGKAQFTFTTQGFERIYRSIDGDCATVSNTLHITEQASCHWLPQETLLYDGGALDRHLNVKLAKDASALIVEPLLIGRLAMGETHVHGSFRESVSVSISGEHVFRDNTKLTGDITAMLDRPAIAAGARAIALILYRGQDADLALGRIRSVLNKYSGASLLRNDLFVARLIAEDGLALRKMLLPILDDLTRSNMPKTWRL
jgi:urease accessory protein